MCTPKCYGLFRVGLEGGQAKHKNDVLWGAWFGGNGLGRSTFRCNRHGSAALIPSRTERTEKAACFSHRPIVASCVRFKGDWGKDWRSHWKGNSSIVAGTGVRGPWLSSCNDPQIAFSESRALDGESCETGHPCRAISARSEGSKVQSIAIHNALISLANGSGRGKDSLHDAR
eukprot:4829717-Amphidinium_carterae.1